MKYSDIKEISEDNFNKALEAHVKEKNVEAVNGYRARTEKDGTVSKVAYEELEKKNQTLQGELQTATINLKSTTIKPHIEKAFKELKGKEGAFEDFMSSHEEELIGLETEDKIIAKVKEISSNKAYMFDLETAGQKDPVKIDKEEGVKQTDGMDLIDQFS